MQKPLSILFCIMDWGIGHATRSSVLIDELLHQGVSLTIASSGAAKDWLQMHYPTQVIIEKPGVEINYPESGSIAWALMKQTPALIKLSKEEYHWTHEMILEHKFEAVISDNCYGCYNESIPSVIIAHQLNLQLPLPSKIVAQKILNKQLIGFHQIWIPDFLVQPNMSGALSESKDSRVRFIGPLSRFQALRPSGKKLGWVGLVSGPEPRRSIFEKELFLLLSRWTGEHHLFTGTKEPKSQSSAKVHVHSIDASNNIQQALEQSNGVICRSGYSSLMDLSKLRVAAILVPTQGQAEQEYLAHHWKQHFSATIAKVKDLQGVEPTDSIIQLPACKDESASVISEFIRDLQMER